MLSILKSIHYYKKVSVSIILLLLTIFLMNTEHSNCILFALYIVIGHNILEMLHIYLHNKTLRHSLIGPWYTTYITQKIRYETQSAREHTKLLHELKSNHKVLRKIFGRKICKLEIDTYLHVVIDEHAINDKMKTVFTIFTSPLYETAARKFGDLLLSQMKKCPWSYTFDMHVVDESNGMWDLCREKAMM